MKRAFSSRMQNGPYRSPPRGQWPGPPGLLPPPPRSPPPPPSSSPPRSASASASTPGGLFAAASSGFAASTTGFAASATAIELLELEVAVPDASAVEGSIVVVSELLPPPELDPDVAPGNVETEEADVTDDEFVPPALESEELDGSLVIVGPPPPPPSGVSKSANCIQPEATAPASPTRQTIRSCLMAMRAPPGARPPERTVRWNDSDFRDC